MDWEDEISRRGDVVFREDVCQKFRKSRIVSSEVHGGQNSLVVVNVSDVNLQKVGVFDQHFNHIIFAKVL